jgi:hypothetical protein
MPLTTTQTNEIENVLKNALRHKFQSYHPEPANMPFHTRLLGKDRLALFSFIHSLNTNFGTSIFEPVALTIAKYKFKKVETQYIIGTQMTEDAQRVIQNIMDDLTSANIKPDKNLETLEIQKVCQIGKIRSVKPTRVDVFLESFDGELFLFDIKTAKPNKGGFKEFKRTLLEWTACTLLKNPSAKVNSIIAIPYNPYSPKPYSRWTMAGMLDLEKELKVAEEFWDFLGGVGTYQTLLGIFEKVGIELRSEIDEYFRKYNSNNL